MRTAKFSVTVDSDTISGYRTVPVSEVTTDHRVADVYGRLHEVARVRTRMNGSVRIDRADGWWDVFAAGERVTVGE